MTSLPLYRKAPRRKRIGPEASLQMTVVEHLRLRAAKGVIFFSVPNEAKRSEAMGYHLKRMGLRPGCADLVICMPLETPAFLELKASGQSQSDAQKFFQMDCEEAGFRYAVADNIDDALRILSKWGALRSDPLTSRLGREAA